MARLRLARGDLAEAVAFEQERAANAENAADAARVVDRLTGEATHAQGRHREVLRCWRSRAKRRRRRRTGDLVEILALKALALWATNERSGQ